MGEFVTAEAARERFRELADQVDAAYDEMRALSSDGVGNEFRAELAERLETQERTNRGLMYRVFGEIADPPDEAGMVPVLVNSLAARLRIPPQGGQAPDEDGRAHPAAAPTVWPTTGPRAAHVAQAVEAGAIGEDHLRVICRAIDVLPSCVSMVDRDDVERSLVAEASKNDVEIVKAVGRRIDEIFNPDGDYDEADRARRRGLHLGPAGAGRDVAAVGLDRPRNPQPMWRRSPPRCVPAGICPTAPWSRRAMSAAAPSAATTASNSGSRPASPPAGMGSHRGHPVTVIVRTTLAELNQAAHAVTNPDIPMPPPARTGGDTALPMRDVIRMAADGIHYLVVFDDHSERPIYLGRQTPHRHHRPTHHLLRPRRRLHAPELS